MILKKIKEIEVDVAIQSKQKMWLKILESDPTLVRYLMGLVADELGSMGLNFSR